MNSHATRIAKGLAAARRACALNNTPLGADQFEIVVDQMALACSDNAIGPFNYDAFLAQAYKRDCCEFHASGGPAALSCGGDKSEGTNWADALPSSDPGRERF